MMKALGWDDEPRYLESIQRIWRQRFGIDLEIEEDETAFLLAADDTRNHWDFLVVDLLDEGPQVRGKRYVGAELCYRYGSRYPMFLVTREPWRLITGDVKGIPHSVVVKSKELDAFWMATEIVDDLMRRGIYVDTKKVFVIYGHDSETDGATQAVESFLSDELRLNVVRITPGRVKGALMSELLSGMQDAAAFVAICSPDERTVDGAAQARQNVILEIGMAMGLARGSERLIILQRVGDELTASVQMPSNMGGLLSLTFDRDVRDAFPELRERMALLRVHGL